MIAKLDSAFKIVWALLITMLVFDTIYGALILFVRQDIKHAYLLINICCLISIIIIATFIVNFIIIPIVLWIKGRRRH